MAMARKPYPGREPNPRTFPVGEEAELPGHAARRDDAAIKRDVESALFYDNLVNSYQVNVDVRDGVVTLSGTVDSAEEKRAAEEDARAVPGVRDVVSNLIIKGS